MKEDIYQKTLKFLRKNNKPIPQNELFLIADNFGYTHMEYIGILDELIEKKYIKKFHETITGESEQIFLSVKTNIRYIITINGIEKLDNVSVRIKNISGGNNIIGDNNTLINNHSY